MGEELGQNVGVRPAGTPAVRARNRLINFDTPQTAGKDTVRAGRQNDRHRFAVRSEDWLSDTAPQLGDDVLIVAADAHIDLQSTKTEIENDSGLVLVAQGIAIRSDFAEHHAPAHCAIVFRQAQRSAMAPALGRRRFRGHQAQRQTQVELDCAPRRDHRNCISGGGKRYRLVGIVRELGDSAKCAHAPGGLGIGELFREKIQDIAVAIHYTPPALGDVGVGTGAASPAGDAAAPPADRPPAVSLMPA